MSQSSIVLIGPSPSQMNAVELGDITALFGVFLGTNKHQNLMRPRFWWNWVEWRTQFRNISFLSNAGLRRSVSLSLGWTSDMLGCYSSRQTALAAMKADNSFIPKQDLDLFAGRNSRIEFFNIGSNFWLGVWHDSGLLSSNSHKRHSNISPIQRPEKAHGKSSWKNCRSWMLSNC